MKNKLENIVFGEQELEAVQIVAIAQKKVSVTLSSSPEFVSKINKGAEYLESLWQKEHVIYGVTTGVGDSVVRSIPVDLVPEFPRQLSRFHGCGLGEVLSLEQTRATLAVRIASLCRGASGVRYELLERLVLLLQEDILPRIPSEGSVGASGDLTPLSYIAAVLLGEREVFFKGSLVKTAELYAELGWLPLELRPKETLAIMNGTSVMTALACLNIARAEEISIWATRITSLTSLAILGNKAHFDPRLFDLKPFVGQKKVGNRIAFDLAYSQEYVLEKGARLQDTYATRCAPHIIGVLEDTLNWVRPWVQIELNSANDNPLILAEDEEILHGGHFYGGHMAMAMDSLKTAVANVADLVDRQMAILVNEKSNKGLPMNLSGASLERLPINHAFKAAHIGTSAWAAEALKNCMPASVFSRSTESHNQDKVSMGTIASRDCVRVIELTEQVLVTTLLAAVQAVELRQRTHNLEFDTSLLAVILKVRELSGAVIEDRPLEYEIRQILDLWRTGQLHFDYHIQEEVEHR